METLRINVPLLLRDTQCWTDADLKEGSRSFYAFKPGYRIEVVVTENLTMAWLNGRHWDIPQPVMQKLTIEIRRRELAEARIIERTVERFVRRRSEIWRELRNWAIVAGVTLLLVTLLLLAEHLFLRGL